MSLPNFPSKQISIIDPVFMSLSEVKFDIGSLDDSVIMTESLTKIEGDVFIFNLNYDRDSRKVIPLDIIYDIYNRGLKFEVSVAYHDKNGIFIMAYILKDCKIKEILNIVDMDYGSSDLKDCKIRLKWDKFSYFSNLIGYQRFNKINKLEGDNNSVD